MPNFQTRLSFAFPMCLAASLATGCGEVIFDDSKSDDASSDDGSGGSTGGAGGAVPTGGTSASTGGAGGGAPGCPSAEGIVVVGCGFRSNAVVLDGEEGALYILDADEVDTAFFETLWRLDLETHERTSLYEGFAIASPLERTRSFARAGSAFYIAAIEDEPVIRRVPLEGGPSTTLVFTEVREGARVVADPLSPERVYFDSSAGVSRVDTAGNVTIVSNLEGVLVGATEMGAAIASDGTLHLVETGIDFAYGAASEFGGAHGDIRGGYAVVPIDAGLGGLHELRGYWPDSESTLTQIPDGKGAGPPRFVHQGTLQDEINVVLFQQGLESGGLVYMFTGQETLGLFGETPALGGGRVFRGPAIIVDSAVFSASARAGDGGDPALEGTIAWLQ